MARRREIAKRLVLPDPKYGDKLVATFINSMMRDGKKSVAERIMYQTIELLGEREPEEEPLKIFKKAVENARPAVEVRSRRVGGSTYQVPIEIRQERRNALAFMWLIDAARRRAEKTMVDRLCGELLDAYNSRGAAVRKKEDTHRMADANKAFAHYRW